MKSMLMLVLLLLALMMMIGYNDIGGELLGLLADSIKQMTFFTGQENCNYKNCAEMANEQILFNKRVDKLYRMFYVLNDD